MTNVFRVFTALITFLAMTSANASTIRFAPASYNFGIVAVGQSASTTVFIDASVGSDHLRTLDLNGSGALTSGDFTLSRGNCVLGAGGPTGSALSNATGCTFTVTYAPTSAGAVTATVFASDYQQGAWGTMSLSAGTAIPTVTAVSPTSGSTTGGTSITITGTDLTGATGVTIGGGACTSVVATATSITCTTPAGSAGTASVLVTTPGGTNAANTLFTYVVPTPAAIPTLGEWAMIFMASLMAMFGIRKMRRSK